MKIRANTITEADPLAEARFCRGLASTEHDERLLAVNALPPFLASLDNTTSIDFMKLWKGLFFTVWHADGDAQWEPACQSIGALASHLQTPTLFSAWVSSGYRTVCRQWIGIDKWRLHKAYLLVRQLTLGALATCAERGWTLAYEDLHPEVEVESECGECGECCNCEGEGECECGEDSCSCDESCSCQSCDEEEGEEGDSCSGSCSCDGCCSDDCCAEAEDDGTATYGDALLNAWSEIFSVEDIISGETPSSLLSHLLRVLPWAFRTLGHTAASPAAARIARRIAGLTEEETQAPGLPPMSQLDTLDTATFTQIVLFWINILPGIQGIPSLLPDYETFLDALTRPGSYWQKQGLIEPVELYALDPEQVAEMTAAWAAEGISENEVQARLTFIDNEARGQSLAGTLTRFVEESDAALAAFRAELAAEAVLAPSKKARASVMGRQMPNAPRNMGLIKQAASQLATVATVECEETNAGVAERIWRVEGRRIVFDEEEKKSEEEEKVEKTKTADKTRKNGEGAVAAKKRVKRKMRK